eukprot:4230912-Alexandrium_andersonii.AAC.1
MKEGYEPLGALRAFSAQDRLRHSVPYEHHQVVNGSSIKSLPISRRSEELRSLRTESGESFR